MEIIFDRGVYVGKNTSQAACVRVGNIVPQECAKQTAAPSVEKPRRGFSTVSNPPTYVGGFCYIHLDYRTNWQTQKAM